MIKANKLRRLQEAATRDGNPDRFYDDLQEALDTRSLTIQDFSFRELFENFVPDGREIVDSYNPRHGGGGTELMETASVVASSAFAKITGQITYSATMEAFAEETRQFSALIKTIPTQFSGERIAGITRIGDAALAVDEGQPYPQAGVAQDYIDTPATTKRGMIVGLTKEALFFDRTYLVQQRCAEVGRELGINKEKRVIDCVIDENVTTHRYRWRDTVIATYGDNSGTHTWDNLQASNALVDWTDIENAWLLFAGMLDPNTGEPISIDPKHLVVTPQLAWTARRIVNATEITVVTPGYATSANPTQTKAANPVPSLQVVSSNQLAARMATDTSWFVGDLSKAFAYMENWPLTVVQAPANSEAEFTADVVMRWKASERGAAATLEPRYVVKCTA